MKALYIFLGFLYFTCNLNAQQLKSNEIQKLTHLGLEYNVTAWHNEPVYQDFKEIIKEDKKIKGKKIAGLILGGIGVASGFASIQFLKTSKEQNKRYNEDESYYNSGLTSGIFGAGTGIIAIGSLGTSIPLLIGSRKSKKRRDKLIDYYNNLDQTLLMKDLEKSN